jgi:hypothetical protein
MNIYEKYAKVVAKHAKQEAIEFWQYCDNLGGDGEGRRMIAYVIRWIDASEYGSVDDCVRFMKLSIPDKFHVLSLMVNDEIAGVRELFDFWEQCDWLMGKGDYENE